MAKKLNESSDENMKKLILESANEYQTKYKKLKKKRECLCKELEKLKKKNIVIYRLLYRYGEEMDIKKLEEILWCMERSGLYRSR